MVLALTVTFVVLLLSLYVVRLAIHDVDQSGYDRRRLLSVSASEGRHQRLLRVPQSAPPGRRAEHAQHDQVLPAGRRFDRPQHGDVRCDDRSVLQRRRWAWLACPPPSGAVPAAVETTSIGQAPSGFPRAMGVLRPAFAGLRRHEGEAPVGREHRPSNRSTLNGFDGSDADAYFNGSLTVTKNQTFFGSVYVQGLVLLSKSTLIDGHLVGAVRNHDEPGRGEQRRVRHDGGDLDQQPGGDDGDAKASTTIASTSEVQGGSNPGTTGLATPPPKPSRRSRSTSRSGTTRDSSSRTPRRSRAARRPELDHEPGESPRWDELGRAHRRFVRPGLRQRDDHPSWESANLMDGSITMSQHPVWQSTSGNHSLYLVSVNSTAGVCTRGTSKNITTSNQTEFVILALPDRLDVFMYTSGTINMSNQSAMNGQVYGCPVNVTNQTTLNYVPVFVPGLTEVTGFRQNIQTSERRRPRSRAARARGLIPARGIGRRGSRWAPRAR